MRFANDVISDKRGGVQRGANSRRDVTVIALRCPGTAADAVQLTNEFTTPSGIGHPTNTGECQLFLVAFDGNHKVVNELPLDPGQSVGWYTPPADAVAIFAACHEECAGKGELTIDTPIV